MCKSLIPRKKEIMSKNRRLSTALNDVCNHASKIIHKTETKKVIQ